MSDQILPLTHSQMLIWSGQQLAPHEPIYNMAFRFRFSDSLDVHRFQAAFRQLVSSSDALHTVI